MSYFFVAAGLLLLFVGGEVLVRGAVGLAKALGVSPLFIGVVIVGFGTSAPELVVCIKAALAGKSDLALGNVIGSNIANLLLILGAAAVIQPIVGRMRSMAHECVAVLASAVALVGLAQIGIIEQWHGVAFLVALTGFLALSYRQQKQAGSGDADAVIEDASIMPISPNSGVGVLSAVIGTGLLILGSRLLVDGATELAVAFGVSEGVIGLTIVAVGTSLPELATAIVAAVRRHADVALGNVLGSNVFNILAILGTTAVIRPLQVSAEMARLDVWIMLGVTLLVGLFLRTGSKLSRSEGVILLGAYAVYVILVFRA